jgi:hypothetical protein
MPAVGRQVHRGDPVPGHHQNARPSLITDTRNEIEAFTALIRAQESRLALLGDQLDGTDAYSQSLLVQELTDQNTNLSRQASEATQQLHRMQQTVAAMSSALAAAHSVNRSLMAEIKPSGQVILARRAGSPTSQHPPSGDGLRAEQWSVRRPGSLPDLLAPLTWGL